jgi:hypothetical protein
MVTFSRGPILFDLATYSYFGIKILFMEKI